MLSEDMMRSQETHPVSTDNKSMISSFNDNERMMEIIAKNEQSLEDIKMLTSTKVEDQLKVFLIAQARNELMRVVKLTKFLDRVKERYMDKVSQGMEDDELTLKQYNDIINTITGLLSRSSDIIYKVLKDDSLTTILNTTIYQQNNVSQSNTSINMLRDPQSRERARNVIEKILYSTKDYGGVS